MGVRGILRRIRALEQRSVPSEAERVPRLPEWLVRLREEQGFPPIDELGRPDYAAMEPCGAEQRATAESIPAGTEDSRTAGVTASEV
jgi:hypothetical protein